MRGKDSLLIGGAVLAVLLAAGMAAKIIMEGIEGKSKDKNKNQEKKNESKS